MTSTSVFEILSRPLVLVETEEIKTCLGHREFGNEFKKRGQAKEAAFKWYDEKSKDLTIKDCHFEIQDEHKKTKRPFYTYTHINDVNDCDHYQIKVIRNIFKLSSREILEKKPFEKS